MKLVLFPKKTAVGSYDRAIASMAERLAAKPEVKSVYQVGGIADPGISDIDLFVIFEDGAQLLDCPIDAQSPIENYLYIHSLFGCCTRHFEEAREYGFFHNYKYLAGAVLPDIGVHGCEVVAARLRNGQAALEYLLKLFITMTIEKTYGIVKVRNLLLNVKALRYDLVNLGVTSGTLFDMVEQLIEWRKRWFAERPDDNAIRSWFHAFHRELCCFLEVTIAKWGFYLPQSAKLKLARNVWLVKDRDFRYQHSGFRLPPGLGGFGRRYFNIQHRFNKFRFHLEVRRELPEALQSRHELISKLVAHNNRYLPFYLPVPYGVAVF